MAGSDPYQGSLSGIPGMVSGIAGILSGILRNSVRLRPECCPESSEMGVRHRPEHAGAIALSGNAGFLQGHQPRFPGASVTTRAIAHRGNTGLPTARLSHPHIVPLHTFGEVSGLVYFVMGYVAGESLASRLKRQGPFPPEE